MKILRFSTRINKFILIKQISDLLAWSLTIAQDSWWCSNWDYLENGSPCLRHLFFYRFINITKCLLHFVEKSTFLFTSPGWIKNIFLFYRNGNNRFFKMRKYFWSFFFARSSILHLARSLAIARDSWRCSDWKCF